VLAYAPVVGAVSVLGPTVRVVPPSNAAAAPVASLAGVACVSAASCVAVGGYLANTSVGAPMTSTQSSGTWARAEALRLPADAAPTQSSAALDAVSCPATATCVGVGYYENTTPAVLPMVATESAGSWSTAAAIGLPADQGGNQIAQLTSVSCVDAHSCVAVGSYMDKQARTQLMVASEAAGAWHAAVKLALPHDAGTVQHVALGTTELASVSCADAGDCVAVGSYLDAAGGYAPLRVTEKAGAWGPVVRAPVPAVTPAVSSAELHAVSCTSATSCVAVGYATVGASDAWPVIEVETAGAWGPVVRLGIPAATPAAVGGQLRGVTCTSTSSCTAVGELELAGGGSVAAVAVDAAGHWQPLQRVASIPTGIANPRLAILTSVACPLANQCVGVGFALAVSGRGVVTDGEALATRIVPVRPVTSPSPPTGVVASPRDGAVLASWRPGDDGGAAITSFTAIASPGSASCSAAAASCTIRGLRNGQRYSISVTATNAHGTSAPSAPSAAVVPGTVPSAPGGVTVAPSHSRAIVRWHASKGSAGDPVTRYVAIATAARAASRSCATSTNACTLVGLTPGVAYSVTVVAQNAVGTSAQSPSRRFKAV